MSLGWSATSASPLPWRLLVVFIALLEAGLYSFSLYAWPSLVYVFKHEHYYEGDCQWDHNATGHHDGAQTFESDGYEGNSSSGATLDCARQDEKLNLVYSIAISLQVVIPVLGHLYDHCGLLFIRLLCIVFACGGSLLMAFSSAGGLEWLLFPGATFQLLGGAMLSITAIQMTTLFPKRQSTLGSLLSGACDMSMISPLYMKLAYDAGFPLRQSLLVFAALTLGIATIVTFILPHGRDEDGKLIHNNKCGRSLLKKLTCYAQHKKENGLTSHEQNDQPLSQSQDEKHAHLSLQEFHDNAEDAVRADGKEQIMKSTPETEELDQKLKPDEQNTEENSRNKASLIEHYGKEMNAAGKKQNGDAENHHKVIQESNEDFSPQNIADDTTRLPLLTIISRQEKNSNEKQEGGKNSESDQTNNINDSVPNHSTASISSQNGEVESTGVNERSMTEKDANIKLLQPLLTQEFNEEKRNLELRTKSLSVLSLTNPEDARTFKNILKMPLFWTTQAWLVCSTFIGATYFGIFNDLISFLAHEDHQIVSQYTDVFGWFQLSGMPLSMFAGYLADSQHSGGTVEDSQRSISARLIVYSCRFPHCS